MSEAQNLLAWPTCDGYQTVKPLSSKSPCRVWLIRRQADQVHLVLKLGSSTEQVQSLRQEDVLSAQKYVVEFYGVVQTQLGPGLLMEYCPGGSLAALMRQRQPLSLAECVTALAPIAQSVAALHGRGLQHGDLSPGNILLTSTGMPKIIDFQEASVRQQAPRAAGTVGFMAPEALNGDAERVLGERDVYSLGACLWYLLAGSAPPAAARRPPLELQFPQLPQILRELLADSLSDDTARRPGAEYFARTLFSAAGAEPIDWVGCLEPDATHFMQTIHPQTMAGTVRGRLRGRASRARREPTYDATTVVPLNRPPRHSAPAICSSSGAARAQWQGHQLSGTPGRRRVLGSLAVGALVIAGAAVGASGLLPLEQQETVAHAQPPVQASECRIHDAAQVPACAYETSSIVTAFIELSARRDEALNTQRSAELQHIYVEGSDQLERDRQTLAKLAQRKLRLRGLATQLEDISVQARGSGNTVVLAARSTASGYEYLDAAGHVRHRVAAGGSEWIEAEVQVVDGRWKLGKVISRQE